MEKRNWRVRSETCAYRNEPWLTVWEQEVELPNGTVIPDYLVTRIPDVAMIFAVTPDNQVLLVEQYKHGVGRWLYDLPAGYIDAGEDPFEAARRELREETGHDTDDWSPLCEVYFDENRNARKFYYYLARGAHHCTEQNLDATEEIRVHRVPVAELPGWIQRGDLCGMHSSLGALRGLCALNQLTPAKGETQ